MCWTNYYKVHRKSDTSPLLIEADKYIRKGRGDALDIGSGTGRDITYLLSKNYKVTALDKEEESIKIIKGKFAGEPRVDTIQNSYEDFDFVPDTYNFINAQFALFFIGQDKILEILRKIMDSLKVGGIFCGQILGEKDDWIHAPGINYLTEAEIKKVFDSFEIIIFKEIRRKGITVSNVDKFWNYYNIIVRKQKNTRR